MFCKHQWKVLSETVTESKFENSMRIAKKTSAKDVKLPWQLSCGDRKHIQIITCDKCGKVKRYVENI